MEVNGSHQLFDYQHSSKYLLLCSKEEEKKTHTGPIPLMDIGGAVQDIRIEY